MSEFTETSQQTSTTEVKPVTERLSTEIVLAKLKPRQIEAEEGNHYTIYTFENKDGKPVEVLFYSPNELPLIETEVTGKDVVINGDCPRWRTNEEWEDFSLRTIRSSANAESTQQSYAQQIKEAIASGKGMLLVEAGPEALLETAEQLDIELDESLQETLSELKEKRLTNSGLEIVDNVLTGNLINDEGVFKTEHQHEGEALYLLSLTGDKAAQQLLTKKKEAIQKVDEERVMEKKAEFAEQRQKDEESGKEALELKKLVAVHTTRYLPQKGTKGLEIPTTFEGSDWQIPRNTVHFALNHEVTPHMYGNWEDIPCVAISSLEDIIEANGKPTVLNTIDTFWEVGPGKRLKLPENTAIIQSDKLPVGKIITGLETNDVRYKASNLETEDITALSKELSEKARDMLNSDAVKIIIRSFSESPIGDEIKLPKEQMESLVKITGLFENRLNILSNLQEHSVEEVVDNVLNMAKVEITDKQKELIMKKLREKLVTTIKRIAVEKKIIQMGYDVKPGGMWAWGGSWEVTRQTASLGAKLEIPVMAHTDHINSEVEEITTRGLSSLLDVEKIPDVKEREQIFESSKRHIRKEFFPKVTQDTRRMLYLTGVI